MLREAMDNAISNQIPLSLGILQGIAEHVNEVIDLAKIDCELSVSGDEEGKYDLDVDCTSFIESPVRLDNGKIIYEHKDLHIDIKNAVELAFDLAQQCKYKFGNDKYCANTSHGPVFLEEDGEVHFYNIDEPIKLYDMTCNEKLSNNVGGIEIGGNQGDVFASRAVNEVERDKNGDKINCVILYNVSLHTTEWFTNYEIETYLEDIVRTSYDSIGADTFNQVKER